MPDRRPVTIVTYDDLLTVTHIMAGFPAPWYVSGGWAIDAFLGRVTRKHEEVEIGLARQDQPYLHAHLAGWQLFKIIAGVDDANLVPWQEGEWLDLPIHQIVARREGFPEFEFFLNEVRDGRLHFRRDPAPA